MSMASIVLVTSPSGKWFILLTLALALTDFLDGYLAAKLNQKSLFGATLDIVSDIFLRSIMWLRLTLDLSAAYWTLRFLFVAICLTILTIEWCTCAASQVTAAYTGTHWKDVNNKSVALGFTPSHSLFVLTILANGFKSPLGVLAMTGLYGTPLVGIAILEGSYPLTLRCFSLTLLAVCLAGRLIALSISSGANSATRSHRDVALKMQMGEDAEPDWGRRLYPLNVEITTVDLSGCAQALGLLGQEGVKACQMLKKWREFSSIREHSTRKLESLNAQLAGLIADSAAAFDESVLRKRHSLRLQRYEEEKAVGDATAELYRSWQYVKVLRERQGFTSTPWLLKALPLKKFPVDDREREMREEAEEVDLRLQESAVLGIGYVSIRWLSICLKRKLGQRELARVVGTRVGLEDIVDSRQLSISVQGLAGQLPDATLFVAPLATDRESCVRYDMNLLYNADLITADHKLDSPLEIARRENARKVRVYLTARLDGGTEVASELELPLSDVFTWSLGRLPFDDTKPEGKLSLPAGAFSFAVHTMPYILSLNIYVTLLGSRWQLVVPRAIRLATGQTKLAGTAAIGVRSTVGGKQVTHVYQRHHFEEPITVFNGGQEPSEYTTGFVNGTLTWPSGSGPNGYAVPPIVGLPSCGQLGEVDTKPNTPKMDLINDGGIDDDLADYYERKYCWLRLAVGEDGSAMWRSARLMMLRERAEGKLTGEYSTSPIPAFDRELPAHLRRRAMLDSTLKEPYHDAKPPRRTSTSGSIGVDDEIEREEHLQNFIDRVRARSKQNLQIRSAVTYRSVVEEYEIDFFSWMQWTQLLFALRTLFTPYRPLRPAALRDPRHSVNATKQLDLHLQIIQVSGLPRRRQEVHSYHQPMAVSYSSATGFASHSGFVPSGNFNSYKALNEDTSPDIVVEVRLVNFHGETVSETTKPVSAGGLLANADINQKVVIPYMRPRDVEVSADEFADIPGSVSFNVFDEKTITRTLRAGHATHTDTERHFLGSFSLPLPSIFNNASAVEGSFRLDTPAVILGYTAVEDSKESYISISATINPLISITQRQQEVLTIDISPGAEPRQLLAHIQGWLDKLRSSYPKAVVEGGMALGTDLDGKSILACRYVTQTLTPPPEVTSLDDPYAIERVARFVSMIPFLTDDQIFATLRGSTKLNLDVWCTPQTFIDIRAGDWEEHAVLLCNFFNRIDTYRRTQSSNYPIIESFCVSCRCVADECAMFVLRRDSSSGHNELWQPATDECFFFPSYTDTFPASGFLSSLKSFVGAASTELSVNSKTYKPARFCPIRRVVSAFDRSNVWFNTRQDRIRGLMDLAGDVLVWVLWGMGFGD
ncbi:Coiled-coil and C2 domain-containing protein 2A, partial [Perkinsus chesapeaki]